MSDREYGLVRREMGGAMMARGGSSGCGYGAEPPRGVSARRGSLGWEEPQLPCGPREPCWSMKPWRKGRVWRLGSKDALPLSWQ